MTADAKKFSLLSYVRKFSIWHYMADKGENVESEGFFNSLAPQILAGDEIKVSVEGPDIFDYVVIEAENNVVIKAKGHSASRIESTEAPVTAQRKPSPTRKRSRSR